MDLTEGAPDGTFMSILVRDLVAKTAMIQRIASNLLEIQDYDGRHGAIFGGPRFTRDGDAVIDNDPSGGLRGFKLENGRLTASDAVFSGTLNAKNIIVTGSVSAGSSYLLRSNNVVSPPAPVFLDVPTEPYYNLLKSITTVATGTARLKVQFKNTGTAASGIYYKITVNDQTFINSNSTSLPNITQNINLSTGGTVVNIYAAVYVNGRPSEYPAITVNIAELWVAEDPGLLSLLG
ncbi:MAG: hypothetical protein LBG26_02240 [Treponema sp.]|jgi:hypothetical protein|nr:hypothetical protein [Treponema sp.]